jgi:hypothetical protein
MKVQTGLKAGALITQDTSQKGLVNVNANVNVLSGNKVG